MLTKLDWLGIAIASAMLHIENHHQPGTIHV
jgi:hypothetical protein